jgi:hypothetical protein
VGKDCNDQIAERSRAGSLRAEAESPSLLGVGSSQ